MKTITKKEIRNQIKKDSGSNPFTSHFAYVRGYHFIVVHQELYELTEDKITSIAFVFTKAEILDAIYRFFNRL